MFIIALFEQKIKRGKMIYYFLLSSNLFAFRPKLVYNWTKVTNIRQNRPLKSAFQRAVNFLNINYFTQEQATLLDSLLNILDRRQLLF